MKKIMAVLTVLMCFASMSAFAQLKEVRGVQTRVVEYHSDRDICHNYERHGFEFKNENNYTVWVEMELWTNGYNQYDGRRDSGTYDTKSITLNAGEVYVWKCGDKMFDACGDHYERFYVRYRAYKAE